VSEVRSNTFIATAVHALRQHRHCGDTYPVDGWPEVNVALAEYAKHKRMWQKYKRALRHHRKRGS